MIFYEMDAPQVYNSGQQVTGQTSVAAGLARRYGTVLTTAESAVRHPTVVSAVQRFRERWHPSADQVAGQVQTLGVGTSTSAVTITDTDLTAEGQLRAPGIYLHRDINQSPV
jgi:hypothetical protein